MNLNPPVPSVVPTRNLPMWRTRKHFHAFKCAATASKGVKNERIDEKAEGAAGRSLTSRRSRHDPIFIDPGWFSAPPGLALPAGSGPDYWRSELCIDTSWTPIAHSFCEYGKSWYWAGCPLLRNPVTWCESERFIDPKARQPLVRGSPQPWSHPLSKCIFERNETGCIVMAAARCSVIVFERIHCVLSPASSMVHGGRVALPQRASHLSVRPKEHFICAGGGA